MANNNLTKHRLEQAELGRALVDLARNAEKDDARVFTEAAATALKRAIANYAVISNPAANTAVPN